MTQKIIVVTNLQNNIHNECREKFGKTVLQKNTLLDEILPPKYIPFVAHQFHFTPYKVITFTFTGK